MRFTSQFVAFTSICTIIAIMLPPPADAAYIASHPSGNRVATGYEADKLRTIFSLPRLPAGHAPNKPSKGKGKSINDAPSSRFFRFSDSDPSNPLAGILDHSFAHVHSNDVHPPFSPRDASSRRPIPLSRRSSALVHGAGGNDYLVSREAASTRPSKRRLGRRSTPSPIFGIIDIMSGEQGRHLASLALDSSTYNSTNTTSTNSTSSHASNDSFPLNASSNNGTQFYLVDANDSSFNDPANATKHVMVQTDIFDSLYCATFDPNPSGPEPMMMEMCHPSQSENDVKNLDYSYANGVAPIVDYTILAADPHKSQIFEYNPSTGVIKPMWTNSDGSISSRAMFVERDTTTSSTTSSNTMTSAGSSTASSTSPPQPTTPSSVPEVQNVTLVFRPSNLAVSAPPPSTNAADSSADDVVTTTITTTVVHAATATPSSSPSSAAGSPVAAVAGLTMSSSSMPAACSSTSTSTRSPALHAAAAASGARSSSSQATSTGSATTQTASSSMPPSPSVHAAIVASSPGSSSSQATSTDSVTSIQATSSSMPPSPSVYAAIVASSPGLSSSQATSTGSVTTIQATSSSMLPSPSVQAAVVASISGSSSQAISVSSATTSQATSTSQPVRGSLEIEFVPIAVSPSSASITSSSPLSSSPTSPSPSPSSATPSQMNAAAIASAIANLHSSTSTASSTNTSSSVSTTVAPATTTK